MKFIHVKISETIVVLRDIAHSMLIQISTLKCYIGYYKQHTEYLKCAVSNLPLFLFKATPSHNQLLYIIVEIMSIYIKYYCRLTHIRI